MKTPLTPDEHWTVVMQRLDPRRLLEMVLRNPAVRPTVGGRYRHWDSLRHMDPPGDLSHEEWWVGVKLARQQLAQAVPLLDADGQPFSISVTGTVLQLLRQIDTDASGQIAMSEVVANPATRRSYLVSSLAEEAITSSQLEGASTSRQVAKEMLRSGRSPRTRSEQMIVNNFRAMNYVREHREEPLTPELVLDLHRIVTEGTLDDPDDAGRLQRPGDRRVRVWDEMGKLLYTPPPAEQLPERLQRMCDFANRADSGDDYLHPTVRSVILHFWMGHDHPFADGNGRTARAIFYWSMLHRGYWLAEFLTISAILKNARSKYARSFLYTERDDNDLTYFVLYQLDVIVRAIENLHSYLRRKMAQVRETESLLRNTDLNHRQIALIGHALRTPGATYTFKGHARSHGVAYQSARNDLLDLEERGLLQKRRPGRTYHFHPVEDLASMLRA